MRTTDGARGGWPAAIGRALVALAMVTGANAAADMAFGAYATLSTVAWSDYRAAGDIDCLFVGSSYAQRAFDPVAFDAEAGTASASLATPGQVLGDSLDAVRDAVREKGVRRVVLGVGIETFTTTSDPNSRVPYLRAKLAGDPARLAAELAALAVEPGVIGTRSSLNVMFPWTFTSVHSIGGIADNVMARVTGEPYGSAAEKTTPSWHYVGQGYGNYDRRLDRSDGRSTVSVYGHPSIDGECLSQLADICALCSGEGVDLVVVATPHPAFDILGIGEAYPRQMAQVQSVVEGGGGTYIDLSMAEPGVLDLVDGDYGDYEHLNLDGARKASVALARILGEVDGGADPSGFWVPYDEWDRWAAAHPS